MLDILLKYLNILQNFVVGQEFLEAMKFLKLNKTKFYQASTSELFGEKPNKINSFNEKSLMVPRSPYGVSKLYSYWITKVYKKRMVFMKKKFNLIMKVNFR